MVNIDRSFLDWQWYPDTYTCRLFIHCLLKANPETGSFKTTLPGLASELGCSVQNVRTSLKHLISTGELISEATNKYRMITVVNYAKYQEAGSSGNKKPANEVADKPKKVKPKEEYSEAFEELWKIYDCKKDKKAAYKAYKARLKEGYTDQELLTATRAYIAECKKEDRFVKWGKTFLGSSKPFIEYLNAGGENNAVPETEEQRQKRLADEYNARYAGV